MSDQALDQGKRALVRLSFLLCFLVWFSSGFAPDSECSYTKNDLDVYYNDSSVNIQCVWGSAGSADGSGGYIFGVIIPFPSKCGVKSQRILTVSTENEVKCLKHTGYEGLCKFALKNASLETTSDGSKITSVQVLVPWLFNFSMTTNSTFFWMPYKTGIGNMSQCITDVHISKLPAERNNTNTTVGPTTLPETTQDGEGPEEENTNTTVGPTTLPKSTQSNKGTLIIVGGVIVGGVIVVVGIVICLCCYRYRKRRSLQDQEGRKQNLESPSIELTSEAAEEGFDRTREVE